VPSKFKWQEGQLTLFKPESNWTPPTELPDLRGRPLVAFDCETKDLGLQKDQGPGWAFGRGNGGYVCGVSWAAEGTSGYASIAHPDTETNFSTGQVMSWISDIAKSGTRLLFHNASYDFGWLQTMGSDLTGAKIYDSLAACVLVDENEYSYSLDNCCKRAGLTGKDMRLLEDAVEHMGGNRKKAATEIWRIPAVFAGPYAEADAVQTLQLWQRTEPSLHTQELTGAFETEMGLVPMVVAMRKRGIRIDVDRLQGLMAKFAKLRDVALAEIGELMNFRRAATITEIRSPITMEKWFVQEHIRFPRTAKSKQGSFTKEWMEKHEHPLPRACAIADQYEEARSKFLENFLLGYLHKGRIHAEIHQYRSDSGGTRSHRFSYSEPPLQQMPSPDKPMPMGQIGKDIRQCFLPEEGEKWCALDYSQQEPRLTVHFAYKVGATGAGAAVQRYIDNARTDYHQMVAEMTERPRPVAKILNLAMTYGKGKRSLADELGVSLQEAEAILKDYHNRLPFIKSLEDKCKVAASTRGFIRLIDGARMHYPQWEGGWIEWEDRLAAEAQGMKLTPCTYEEAQERRKNPKHPWSKTTLRRADKRKSLNNLVQGSAARQTKRAMLVAWNEGIVPLIQMHDEIGISTADKRVAERTVEIMIETTPLVVPTVVDFEVGPNWGEAKQEWK